MVYAAYKKKAAGGWRKIVVVAAATLQRQQIVGEAVARWRDGLRSQRGLQAQAELSVA